MLSRQYMFSDWLTEVIDPRRDEAEVLAGNDCNARDSISTACIFSPRMIYIILASFNFFFNDIFQYHKFVRLLWIFLKLSSGEVGTIPNHTSAQTPRGWRWQHSV
jgi:hypothetical protein